MHAGGAGFDHGLHQLEGVEHAAEAGLGVGHDGREEVDVVLAFAPLDLVGALKVLLIFLTTFGTESTAYSDWSGYIAVGVGVAATFASRQVDGLQAGLDLLHGLVAGEGAQRVDEGLGVDQVPQLLGTALGQGVLDLQAAAQTHHVGGGSRA